LFLGLIFARKLVSCKSRVFDWALEWGEYAAARNAQTAAEHALRQWTGIVQALRKNPKGDNFDFSSYTRIIGVVCLPTPFFLPRRIGQRFATTDLRAVAFLNELQRWLEKDAAQ